MIIIPFFYMNKKIGFFKGKLLTINPNLQWIKDYYNDDITEDPVYNFTKDGVNFANIDVYIDDENEVTRLYRIQMENCDSESRNGMIQYVNQVGEEQWVKSSDDLYSSFINFERVEGWKNYDGTISSEYSKGCIPEHIEVYGSKEYRIAVKGEYDLLHLMSVYREINKRHVENTVFFDRDKVFSGDFSEIRSFFSTIRSYDLVSFLYLDKDRNECIWKRFLPLKLMRDINNNMNISIYNRKIYDSFISYIENKYTGIKNGYYKFNKISLFKEEDFYKKELSEDGPDY